MGEPAKFPTGTRSQGFPNRGAIGFRGPTVHGKGRNFMTDDELGALGITRRSFIKKMIAAGFAVPIVSSFTLDGVASAENEHYFRHGNQTHYPFPNQPQLLKFPFPNQNRIIEPIYGNQTKFIIC